MNKSEIRKEVEKRQSTISPEEIFSSHEFAQLLEATITAVCEKLGRIPSIRAFYNEQDPTTAFTNGEVVTINTASPLIRQMPTNWEKYVANIGHVTHECGHVLFTDFANLNPLRHKWDDEQFSYYPTKPKHKKAKEIQDYINGHKFFKKLFVQEMSDVVNIMEDVYIENRLYEQFNGLCTVGLHKVNDEKYRLSLSYNQMLDACLNYQIFPLTVAKSVMSIRKLGYEPKISGPLTDEQLDLKEQIEKVLKDCDVELDKLAYEQDGKQRAKLFNEVLCKLYELMPTFPEFLDQMAGMPGMEELEGQEDYSDLSSSQLSTNSRNMGNESGMSSESKGNGSAISSKPKLDEKDINEKKTQAQKLSQNENSMKREFNQAIKEVVKAQVINIDEQEHCDKLQKEAKHIELEILNNIKVPCFTRFRLVRTKDIYNKDSYKSIYSSIAKTSNDLARKITNILKCREEESNESGFLMGQKFNASDIVHRDGKYFSRVNVPDGKLKVVFGVVIDESGSMAGRNRDRALQSAILMEDCLRKLNIPLMVVGHNSHQSECTIKSYVDFDTNDGKDRYRLSSISASGCNCDGAVIKYVTEKLLKRPEQIKVMIVISDGSPTRTSFFEPTNPVKDTMLAIKEARRKGLRVFGAVVDDYENVSEIYGKDYSFDCRKDESLSKELQKLIKKYCLLKG